MSILRGGSGKRAVATMTDTQYIADIFLPSVTPLEWAMIRQLPPIKRWTQLVSIVVHLREGMEEPPP